MTYGNYTYERSPKLSLSIDERRYTNLLEMAKKEKCQPEELIRGLIKKAVEEFGYEFPDRLFVDHPSGTKRSTNPKKLVLKVEQEIYRALRKMADNAKCQPGTLVQRLIRSTTDNFAYGPPNTLF